MLNVFNYSDKPPEATKNESPWKPIGVEHFVGLGIFGSSLSLLVHGWEYLNLSPV
jgi:hypothetical protein